MERKPGRRGQPPQHGCSPRRGLPRPARVNLHIPGNLPWAPGAAHSAEGVTQSGQVKTQEMRKGVATGTVDISPFLEKTKAETWNPLQLCERALLSQCPDDELAQRVSSFARGSPGRLRIGTQHSAGATAASNLTVPRRRQGEGLR